MKNVAILGLGNIANRVAKGVICSPKACLYAVASRNVENAKKFSVRSKSLHEIIISKRYNI